MTDAPHGSAEARQPSRSGRRLLSPRKLWLCVGASLAVFLLADGPVWKHPWAVDRAILWSYAVIPLLVAVSLAFEKNLRWLPFLLATLEVTLWKFGATYALAHTVWLVVPPPAHPA